MLSGLCPGKLCSQRLQRLKLVAGCRRRCSRAAAAAAAPAAEVDRRHRLGALAGARLPVLPKGSLPFSISLSRFGFRGQVAAPPQGAGLCALPIPAARQGAAFFFFRLSETDRVVAQLPHSSLGRRLVCTLSPAEGHAGDEGRRLWVALALRGALTVKRLLLVRPEGPRSFCFCAPLPALSPLQPELPPPVASDASTLAARLRAASVTLRQSWFVKFIHKPSETRTPLVPPLAPGLRPAVASHATPAARLQETKQTSQSASDLCQLRGFEIWTPHAPVLPPLPPALASDVSTSAAKLQAVDIAVCQGFALAQPYISGAGGRLKVGSCICCPGAISLTPRVPTCACMINNLLHGSSFTFVNTLLA